MLLIEFCLTVLVVLVALLAPRLGNRWFTWIERRVSKFASRRRLAVLTILLLALGARRAVLPIEPVPQPGVHDEFSYLLMADTFAHGRVTNPTHPMWVHFETFHVNQQPTYGSMYYPAQGLFLAFGQVVFGHPFWGVWLSVGLMCAAFCWALQGWMPAAWAFLGGIIAIIRLGTFSYWANSYWGGAVAAIGGALVLGAFPRIKRRRRVRDALILSLGLAILGNSRPYESVFYAAPLLIALALFIFRSKNPAYARRVLLPLGTVLLITFFAMGYYFWRCTGSPFRPPYTVNMRAYGAAPLFPWQGMGKIPTYRYLVMERFYEGWPVQQYYEARHSPAVHLLAKLLKGGLFFVGPTLGLPWLFLGWILPYGMSLRQFGLKTGTLLATCFLSAVGLSLPVYFEPHYAAPICCASYALELQALRRVCVWDRQGKKRGRSLVRYLITACILLFVIRGFAVRLHLPELPDFLQTWSVSRTGNFARAAVLESLTRQPARNLIITRYGPNHDSNREWVYNGADIDGSKVVWARDTGEEQNLELIRYFKDRKVWVLEPDFTPPRLSPYPIPHSDDSDNQAAIRFGCASRQGFSPPEVR